MALPLPNVLSDVGPGGPLVTSMRGTNALLNDIYGNQIKNVEAQYAPWTNYANAASKIAYSQFVGPQSIGAILANPQTRGMFSPEQYNQLTNAFTQQMQNPAVSLGSMPLPGRTSNSLLGMLFNRLNSISNPTNSLIQNQNMPSNLPITSGSQPEQSNPQANADTIAWIADHGNDAFRNPNFQVPQGYANNRSQQSAIPGGSPIYNREAQKIPTGTYGASNPPAVTQAGEAAMKAQATSEAKAISDQWKDRQDEINSQISGAQEMERQLNKLVDARSRLNRLEKGPGLGSLPAVSAAAQDSDIAISNLVAARLKAWQSSRITNMDIGFGQMLKPGRYMKDEPFHNEVNYEKGLAERTQEYPAFAQMAQQSGLTPAQADAIWARYANEKPFFEPKSKQILGGNLNTWEQYLDPNSIKETFSPNFKKKMDTYRKNMAGGDKKQDEKIMNEVKGDIGYIDMGNGSQPIKMKTPDGQVWMIHPNNIQEAIKRGARQVK